MDVPDTSTADHIDTLYASSKADDDQTKQKEEISLQFPHSSTSQHPDFMDNSAVTYHEDLNILSKLVASENVPSNQYLLSKEPKSELASDHPSPTKHRGSCDKEDQPFGVLSQTNQTFNEITELSFSVSLPKMDNGQKKESLTSKDPEKDDSPDVFEKDVNKPFEYFTRSQDVPVTSTVDETDLVHASSKAAPEAVSSRFFGFEELLPTTNDGPINDDRSKAGSQTSEYLLTTVEVFENRTSRDSDQALSPSENEYCIPPGYDEVSSTFDYNAVQTKVASPTFELSDTEAYFDCKQGASDISETESEEPDSKLHKQPCHYPRTQRNFQQTLLPSENEDYEDCPFTYEPLCNVQEENEEDSSDEEFTLCEAPPKTTFCETDARDSGADDDDDTNESMSREIKAQLGTQSESSDDDFLTTRIIRRRVIIKADEMADFLPQSVSEETYTDENGHTVVKKVTRRVIRKCTSSDDAMLDQDSSEAGAHSRVKASQGDGYSKVVKRTVVKSEGDQSEVTFTECESLLKQDKAEDGRTSRVEKTIVLEGEQTMTQHGGHPPSAQDDFKKAVSYVSFHETELPRVVHRETVKDDGTLVKRAQMCKVRSRRRTTMKGAGQRKQVLLEGPGLGSKSSDLKQHLHQLFHRYYEQTHGETTDEEDT